MAISSERIENKELKIGVVGLGYVGFPLALAFSEAGVKVLGFDIDRNKVRTVNEGKSYFNHIAAEEVKKFIDQDLLAATYDFREIEHCDAAIICVPTPLDAHLEPDLRYVTETCEMLSPYCTPGTLISLESTTWPGTTLEVVKPIFESNGKRKVGEDLFICYSPEREDPGNASFGTKTIPKLVGADDPLSLEFSVKMYELALNTVIPLSSTQVAESAKLFENIFRSVNIALVNELKVIFDRMGIDVWEVVRAAETKPFGFMPFWPGPGLGGHCIPIDPYYLTWKAREYGINTRFIELAGEINRGMPRWVVGKVQDCLNNFGQSVKGARLLILGMAYKPDVDDMRESPSLELMRLLEEKGAHLAYHDPYIPVIGATREYREFEGRQSQPVTGDYDCFVLATHHKCFDKENLLSQGVPIVDTRNFFPRREKVFSA